jgi:hypothetical protein
MEPALVVNACDADLEHVVVLAGHAVATNDAFGTPDRGLKGGQHRG